MSAANSNKTAPGRPFQKGKSGNPSGRPKANHKLIDLAKEHTAEAIKTLVGVMRKGDTATARALAADKLLDRGWGKATQHIEANVNVIDQLSDEDKRAVLAALDTLSDGEGSAEDGAETRH